MAPTSDALKVAVRKPHAAVMVQGRATFKTAPALKQFGAAALAEGCTVLVLDMRDCVGMDSTFMGVVGGLAMRFRKEAGGDLAMANLSPKNSALLATLGLDRCIRTEGAERDWALFAGASELTALDAAPNRDLTTATMLDAHHTLVDIAPANLDKFKDVIAYLQDEMQRVRDKDVKGG